MGLMKKSRVLAPINYYRDPKTKKDVRFHRLVGHVMQDDLGNEFLSLNQDFNPLGCLHDPLKGSIFLPLEAVNDEPEPKPKPRKARARKPATKLQEDLYDIPFDDELPEDM